MNDINELIYIIEELKENANIDNICDFLSKKRHRLIFAGDRFIVLETLKSNPKLVRFNDELCVWELVTNNINKNSDSNCTHWILPCNPLIYNHFQAFKDNNVVYWHQNNNFVIGDIVYIYSSKNIHSITTVTKVVDVNVTKDKVEYDDSNYWINHENDESSCNRFVKLQLVKFTDDIRLDLEHLTKNGLKSAPQGACKVAGQLYNYIISVINNDASIDKIYNKLVKCKFLDSSLHDGSYELMQVAITEYKKLTDFSIVDVNDMNFIYPLCVGSWKISFDIRKNRLNDTHLTNESKEIIRLALDRVWNKACNNEYTNEKNTPKNPAVGMFGTGFMSFAGKLSNHDSSLFIEMLTKIVDSDDENEVFSICDKYISDDSFIANGLKSASASAILHCLKPCVFPVLNANDGHGTIFDKLGINIEKPKEIKYYISNCRRIKKFRDDNFIFKNYRIMDMAAWELDDSNFNLFEYVEV